MFVKASVMDLVCGFTIDWTVLSTIFGLNSLKQDFSLAFQFITILHF